MKPIEWKRFGNTKYIISNNGLVISGNISLEGGIDTNGYRFVNLRVNGVTKIFYVHVLVAMLFLGHIPDGRNTVVHHKDNNKLNNNDWNLEIITFRANCSIERTLNSSSKYVGVCWCTRSNKWISRIRIKGKSKYLGSYDNELDASDAYQNALNILNKDTSV